MILAEKQFTLLCLPRSYNFMSRDFNLNGNPTTRHSFGPQFGFVGGNQCWRFGMKRSSRILGTKELFSIVSLLFLKPSLKPNRTYVETRMKAIEISLKDGIQAYVFHDIW